MRIAIGALVLGRMGIGAIGVARAQAAFDFSTHDMTQRKVFGKQLARRRRRAAMAKIAGSRLACDIARDAIQICGAYGFVKTLSGAVQRFPLESICRDARIGEIHEGANEFQSWVIARHIFGREMTG